MKRPTWVNLLIISVVLVAVEILVVGICMVTDTATKVTDILVFGAGITSIFCALMGGFLKLKEEGIL